MTHASNLGLISGIHVEVAGLERVCSPVHSLQEGLFFCQLDLFLGQVSPDAEAVLDAAVQEDLVWVASLLQDALRFMALLCCEDRVGL